MSASLKGVGAITLFVEDLQRSKAFYQDVFGLSVAFADDVSAAYVFENTIINLLTAPAAADLIQPGNRRRRRHRLALPAVHLGG